MKSRIKLSHFYHEIMSYVQYFFGKTLIPTFLEGFSDINHNFAVLFFYCKKWFKKWKKIIQARSAERPAINASIEGLFSSPSIGVFGASGKMVSKPVYKHNVTGGNLYQNMPLLTLLIGCCGIVFYFPDVETTFAIDNSSQVSYFSGGLSCLENNSSSHSRYPLVNYHTIINESKINVQRERLNKETHFGMRKSELVTKAREADPKRSARLAVGHKSNRSVLNRAAARLGQSLRETEDQLIRDMLEATASVINCVGGTNGSDVAILKSDLIDSDAYSICHGNEAQAEAAMLLAA